MPGEKVSIQRIIFHSPVPLMPIERRKLDAKICQLGLHSAEDLKELIRELYQDQGYCKAELSMELVPVPGAGIQRNTLVVRVKPGKQYRVTRIFWRGATVFPESELQKVVPIQPGEVFSRTKFADGLSAARKLYESQGYINFTSVPNPEFNEKASTVAFEIDVDEGSQYYFGELLVEGMEEPDRKILLDWQRLQGRVYDVNLADQFFNRYFRSPWLNIKPEDYTVREIDGEHHAVNYVLRLVPNMRYRVTGIRNRSLLKPPDS